MSKQDKGGISNQFAKIPPHKKGVTLQPATEAQQKFFEDAVTKAIAYCNRPEVKAKHAAERRQEAMLVKPFKDIYKPIIVTLDVNQIFINLRDVGAYDRPAAMWEVASIIGKDFDFELAMHSPLDMIWNDGEITPEGREELDALAKYFDGNIPPAILESGWST